MYVLLALVLIGFDSGAPVSGTAAVPAWAAAAGYLQQQPAQQVRPLPSGFSFGELQAVLGRLRPREVPRMPAAVAGPDGIQRLEIDGLVVDETVTRMGRDFYEVFHAAWEPPEGQFNYIIRLQEQPIPGLGTRVILLFNDEVLFQLQLQPRYDYIEELAQLAAQYTREELERRSG
jgi:hypothetical protein